MSSRKIAIVADIHGNLKAFKTILKVLRKEHGITNKSVLCIGDIFGYGSQQVACYDIAKTFGINLHGNNDGYATEKLENPSLDLTKYGASPAANAGVDQLVQNLVGEIRKISPVTGFQLTAPEESLEIMRNPNYGFELLREFVEKTNAEVKSPSPKIGRMRLSSAIPKKILDKVRGDYLKKVLYERPDLLENYLLRLSRRNKVLEIYKFLTDLKPKLTYEFENAILVHDNPLNPGDGKYLVDRKTADELNIDPYSRAKITEITRERFPGKEYIIVGHNHVRSKILKLNDPRLVPYIVNVGSVGRPRPRDPKGDICCVVTDLENNRLSNVEPLLERAS